MRSKILLAALLALGLLAAWVAVAGDTETRVRPVNPRTEADVPRRQPTATPAPQGPSQVATELEPGAAAIEETYRPRMQALKDQLASATTPEAEQALQQQAAELKLAWTLALANHQLELARARGDAAEAANLLRAIDRMTNPTPVVRQPVPRDPVTGAELEGGAR